MLAAAYAWSDIANLEIVVLMETDEVLKLLETEKTHREEAADQGEGKISLSFCEWFDRTSH